MKENTEKKEIQSKELSKGAKFSAAAIIAVSVTGAFTWVFVLAFLLKIPVLFLTVFFISMAGTALSYKIYIKQNKKYFTTFAFTSLWVLMVNGVVINIVYKWIPNKIGPYTTGKAGMSLTKINISLWLFLMFVILSFTVDLLDVFSMDLAKKESGEDK